MKKLTALLFVLICLFTLCSCESMSAEDSAKTMLDSIISGDYDTLKMHVDSITLYEPVLPEVIKDAVYKNCTYEIVGSAEVDSKNKTVDVEFTNLDVNTIMQLADADIAMLTFDEKKINSDIHSADAVYIYTSTLKENSSKTVKNTVTLSFTKISGNWVCNLGAEQSKVLLGAMYGGYEFE